MRVKASKLEEIKEFLSALQSEKSKPNCYVNQYSTKTLHHEITTENLEKYLISVCIKNPKYMFVGEAPGWRGCRITGIPFTSEFILKNSISGMYFGEDTVFEIVNNGNPSKEQTVKIVWEVFLRDEYLKKNIIPCFWNAFPFHPHKPNNLISNRKPSREELLLGKKYLEKVYELFNCPKVVTIGKVARSVLRNIDCKGIIEIRHPSFGGKTEFNKGMERLLTL